ncbi:hypothetical protein ABZP36_010297 [Zizania latifolia]
MSARYRRIGNNTTYGDWQFGTVAVARERRKDKLVGRLLLRPPLLPRQDQPGVGRDALQRAGRLLLVVKEQVELINAEQQADMELAMVILQQRRHSENEDDQVAWPW